MRIVKFGLPLMAALLMTATAFAQPPGGGGGFGGGQGRGQGRGFGQFGMMGRGELTLASVPLKNLTPALNLTADQQGKIGAIQMKIDQMRQAARPNFGGGGAGGGGFDREAFQQMMEEMRQKQEQLRASEQAASKQIEALLTDDQKTALAPKMREWKVIQQLGLALESADQLKLTPDQITVLEKLLKERAAQMQQGGPGGRRGGGGAK